MKLYAVVTPSRLLYERFFSHSLDTNAFELYPCLLEQDNTGGFLAEDWKNCIRFKLEKILESIHQNPSAIIVVWSDIDIQFFRLQPSHTFSYFDQETDFVAQWWSSANDEICGGFYAVRCSPRMYDFFTAVRDLTPEKIGGNEQNAINLALKMLGHSHQMERIRFGILFRSHGIRIAPKALLQHASCIVDRDYVNWKISTLAQSQNFNHWYSARKRLYA